MRAIVFRVDAIKRDAHRGFTMTENTVTVSILTKSLPAALRELAKQSQKRPAQVEVTVTTGANSSPSYWRTERILSLGEEVTVTDTSRMNEGGEWDSSAEVRFTGPALHVASKCGRAPAALHFFVGHIDSGLVDAIVEAREQGLHLKVVELVALAVDQSCDRMTNAQDQRDALKLEAAAKVDAATEAKRAAAEAQLVSEMADRKAARATAKTEHEAFLQQLGF